MEQSPLVQRAAQRLRDGIARRETTLDLEAIKAVLVEMATQKERADRLEKELAEVRLECSHQRCLAELLAHKAAARTKKAKKRQRASRKTQRESSAGDL